MHQDFYTPTEIQNKLRISRPTFYRYVKDGRLPVVRVGGALRVSESTLQDVRRNGIMRAKQAVSG